MSNLGQRLKKMNDRIKKLKELSDKLKGKDPKGKSKGEIYTKPFLRDNVDQAIDPRTKPLPEMNETARKFMEMWGDFTKEQIAPRWRKEYVNPTKRTMLILGNKKSKINEGSHLGQFILKHFKDSKFRYRKEDGLFDLTVAPIKSFKNVMSQHILAKERELVIEHQHFYPTYYELLIEVENDVERCYEEMTKLVYAKSKLKVLITYNWNTEQDQDYHYVNKILRNNFSEIIRQSNTNFPENKETQYMLIVFQRKDDKLFWNNWVFTSKKGELIVEFEGRVASTTHNIGYKT